MALSQPRREADGSLRSSSVPHSPRSLGKASHSQRLTADRNRDDAASVAGLPVLAGRPAASCHGSQLSVPDGLVCALRLHTKVRSNYFHRPFFLTGGLPLALRFGLFRSPAGRAGWRPAVNAGRTSEGGFWPRVLRPPCPAGSACAQCCGLRQAALGCSVPAPEGSSCLPSPTCRLGEGGAGVNLEVQFLGTEPLS